MSVERGVWNLELCLRRAVLGKMPGILPKTALPLLCPKLLRFESEKVVW